MNIVIMGATSHIAKGLIDRFLHRGDDHLYLFSRSGEKVQHFLDAIGGPGKGNHTICTDYQAFSSYSYDVVINCVGVETRNKHDCDFTRYFTVTEEFDNLAIRLSARQESGCALFQFQQRGRVWQGIFCAGSRIFGESP